MWGIMRSMEFDYNAVEAITSGSASVFMIAYYVLYVIAAWKVFSKAGVPGILAVIPIVNTIFMIRIAGYSGWWVLIYLVPLANVIAAIFFAIKLGERFGKGGVFSFFLLWLIPFVGLFIIGFGDARYRAANR